MVRDPDDVAPSLHEGDQVAGYVIEARIGVGGFGEVYRARHPMIGREVAIKVLHGKYSVDPDAISRFVAEARSVNQISHPNIVEVFDFGKLEDGREFCVMELIAGTTLRDVLRARTRIPLAEALPILRGIAEAVDAAHAAGIAHRDLKPDNVFVLTDRRGIKLIDFGLAKLTRELDTPVTRTGSVFGTPIYMSPEQCRGKAIDTRTDLYSFGVLAYHMLTGEPPFGGDALELALHHLNDHPMPPSKRCKDLSRNVDRVLLALLAKDPADRPHSLVNSIDALAGATTLRARRWKQRGRRGAFVIAPLALTAGIVAWVRHVPATVDDCVPAADRLAHVWDAPTREAIAKRFAAVDRPELAAGWPARSTLIDGAAAQWAVQWDAACHATKRESDPLGLLRAEQLTCLENVLLELHGLSDWLSTGDAGAYAQTSFVDGEWSGLRSLDDCANPSVLQAQVPAPPPAVRDRVTQLLLESYRTNQEVVQVWWVDRDSRFTISERAIDRLDKIAHELELIDPPAAAQPILDRVGLFESLVLEDGPKRLPEARAALAQATRRIEATRDYVAIATAYLIQAVFETSVELDGDTIAKATDALERAELAAAQAGHPHIATVALAYQYGILALETGQLDAAIAAARDAIRLSKGDLVFGGNLDAHRLLVNALSRAGHDREAIEEAKRTVEIETALYGPNDVVTLSARNLVVIALARAGDAAAAFAERQRLDPLLDPFASPNAIAWNHAYELELALLAGHANAATEATAIATVHALAGQGTTPTLQSKDGAATVRRAGMFEAFALAAERDAGTDTDAALDSAAILAFERGDDQAMAGPATIVAERCAKPRACTDWIRFSRWLAVLADAKAGHTVKLDERLAAIETDYGGAAAAYTGIVLASLGRWHDARVKLEAARATPNMWARLAECDLAEVDAWLGLARIEDGDAAHARPILEESLAVLSVWANGFSYMTPPAELALARLLWDANAAPADRARAHVLGERARDGFARLGTLREPERQQAIAWLAAHAAP